MHSIVHDADIHDRDDGVVLMASLFGLLPFLLKLNADSGYTGPKFQQGLKQVCGQINVEIVKRRMRAGSSCCPSAGSWSGPSVAHSLEATGQGLGVPEPECAGILAMGVDQTHGPKIMSGHNLILDSLLDFSMRSA